MSETGYTEDCCFNYVRDHCPLRRDGKCPCRCHVEMPETVGGYMDGFRAATAAADGAMQKLMAENERLNRLVETLSRALDRYQQEEMEVGEDDDEELSAAVEHHG